MADRGETGVAPRRAIIYCLVPGDLADKLHEPLRAHFAETADVEVVVEQRSAERRGGSERRAPTVSDAAPLATEPRVVRNPAGRRIADRRRLTASVPLMDLPRKARPHRARIAFVEVVEPRGLDAEDLDTRRLVTRFQAGDTAIFEAIYRRYFDRVYAYLKVALRTSNEAEDVCQQVFLSILEALPRYQQRPGVPFRAWLFTIVRRAAISQLRHAGRLELVDPAEVVDDQVARVDTGVSALSWLSDRDLLVFIERLPLLQQQVLVLRFMLELQSSEIAEILGISPENVRVLQSRALSFLRQRLSALGFDRAVGTRPARSRGVIRKSAVLRTRRFALAQPRAVHR